MNQSDLIEKVNQFRLMKRLGAPDYKTALKMQEETYQKFLKREITGNEDYELRKELNEEEKTKKKLQIIKDEIIHKDK